MARCGSTRVWGEGTARRGAEAEHACTTQMAVRVPATAALREGYAEWSLSVRHCPGCVGQGLARNMATRKVSVRQHTVPTRARLGCWRARRDARSASKGGGSRGAAWNLVTGAWPRHCGERSSGVLWHVTATQWRAATQQDGSARNRRPAARDVTGRHEAALAGRSRCGFGWNRAGGGNRQEHRKGTGLSITGAVAGQMRNGFPLAKK
jgi:hypothetical protein